MTETEILEDHIRNKLKSNQIPFGILVDTFEEIALICKDWKEK